MSEFDKTHNRTDDHDDDDDQDWIPLVSTYRNQKHNPPSVSTSHIHVSRPKEKSCDVLTVTKNSSHTSRSTLEEIRSKHERNVAIKNNLVEKPLSLIPASFLRHFVHEVWNCRHATRLGISLFLLGILLQGASMIFCLNHAINMVFYIMFLAFISFLYLFGFKDLKKNFPTDVDSIISMAVEKMTGSAIRNVVLIAVYFLPFLLQSWTFAYLSHVISVHTNAFSCLCLSIVNVSILLHRNFEMNITNSNKGSRYLRYQNDTIYIGTFLLTLKHPSSVSDSQLWFWIYLYVLATMSSCLSGFQDAMFLLSPLITSCGILILSSSRLDEEGNDVIIPLIRRILRQTLADVLKQVGDNVSGNDIFRLAMIRWLVDYWTTSSTSPKNGIKTEPAENSSNSQAKSEPFLRVTNSPNSSEYHDDIGWNKLSAMLSMTTTQMFAEVGTNARVQNASIAKLRNMLDSLNIDDRARPAVNSYKEMVNQCEIPKSMSIFIAVLRRCPGTACVLFQWIRFSKLFGRCTILLLPAMFLEFIRVICWTSACQKAYDYAEPSHANLSGLVNVLANMPSMDILLSRDDISSLNRGPELQLWYNIQSSVSALESGLVATKCLQTATIATDLAFNVISLSHYATELQSVGLKGALLSLMFDIFQFHMDAAEDEEKTSTRTSRSKISSAAVNVLDNSQLLKKNLNELLSHGVDVGRIFSPIVAFSRTVSSRVHIPRKGRPSKLSSDSMSYSVDHDNKISSSVLQESTATSANLGEFNVLQNDLVISGISLDKIGTDGRDMNDDDDASWEEITDHNSEEENVKPSKMSHSPPSETRLSVSISQSPVEANDGDDILKWIGIGGAIVGTLLGGVALFNSTHKGNQEEDADRQSARNSHSKTSSVPNKIMG